MDNVEGMNTDPAVEAEADQNQPDVTTEGDNTPSFLDTLPEKYRADKSFTNIKSIDELCEQFSNSQSLIGKKAIGVPEANAPQEAWDEYFNKLRPESFEKYELPEIEESEGFSTEELAIIKATISDEQKDFVKKMFHEAGLTQKQAEILNTKYNSFILSTYKDQLLAAQNQGALEDKKYDEMVTNLFGQNKDKALSVAHSLIGKYFPEEHKQTLLDTKSEFVVGLVKMLNDIHTTHISEDAVVTTASDQKVTGGSVDLKSEFGKLVTQLESTRQGTKEYDELLARKADLARRMASAS